VSHRLGFGDDKIPGGALSWVNWLAGVAAVYSAVFGVGQFLTGSPLTGWIYSGVAVVAFLLIQRNLRLDPQLMTHVDTPVGPGLRFDPGE
jgi:hypothetical protein